MKRYLLIYDPSLNLTNQERNKARERLALFGRWDGMVWSPNPSLAKDDKAVRKIQREGMLVKEIIEIAPA